MKRSALITSRLGRLAVAAGLATALGSCGGGAKILGQMADGDDKITNPDFATPEDPVDMSAEVDLAFECGSLECQKVKCGEQPPTRLVGQVFAPNGTLPLYNAIVYIPTGPLDPIKNGYSCDRCDGTVSGHPLAITQTGPDGKFILEDVPAGDGVPLVVQIGKWRRKVILPTLLPCQDNKVAPNNARMPKNRAEGDIPQMAIATGSADPFECLFLKMGMDPKEVRNPGKGGRMEMFRGPVAPGTSIDANTPKSNDQKVGMYMTPQQLSFYDIVFLPCEGTPTEQEAVARKNIVDYLNSGGRLFTTHYGYDWLTYKDSPFNRIQKPMTPQGGGWDGWHTNAGAGGVVTSQLVSDFPKGKALRKWLVSSKAQSPDGTLSLSDIRYDIDSVDRMLAQPWTITMNNGTPSDSLLTFNTPLDAPYDDDAGVRDFCGRVVYSDFHVAAAENQGGNFPNSCRNPNGMLSDQEMALVFMIFDLSSCIIPDTEIPIP